jgi:putative phage-type endonuclease
MKILNLTQGTPEWHAHRTRHLNASDAPAMMGVSPYTSRAELVRQRATGIAPDVDPATQMRFDQGHRAEALARPLAEQIIGEELSPLVGVGDEGAYSASYDGLTLMEDVAFEHKLLNETLRAAIREQGGSANAMLPEAYLVQMEHQCLVCLTVERVLFMASQWADDGTLIEERHCWYTPDSARCQSIMAGWEQFEADVAAWAPEPAAPPPVVAQPVVSLPVVVLQTEGQITVRENFRAVEAALRDFLDKRLIREPKTDQDFADLDAQIKTLKKAEDALNAAEAQMLAQIQSVDAAKRQKDMLYKLVRDNRLMSEKLLAVEKQRRRDELVIAARKALNEHYDSRNREFKDYVIYLSVDTQDFVGAIKGLKTLASIQNALDTAIANGKIAIDQSAADLREKLFWFDCEAAGRRALFADLQQIVEKPTDDFQRAVRERIEKHKAEEAQRQQAEIERIRAEEKAKAEAELGNGQNGQQVVAAPTTAAAIASAGTAPTLKLGEINARLEYIAISADGLRALGFAPAGKERSAVLYHERSFAAICDAIAQQAMRAKAAHQGRGNA